MIYYITDEEKADLQEEILSNIYADPNSGCWIWIRACSKNGYGQLRFRKKTEYVHRISYFVFVEVTRLFVCHKCDTTSCCNPQHLFAGNNVDNVRDAISKNRMRYLGEQHGKSIITEFQVIEIRKAQGTYKEIGEKFNVSASTVSAIKNKTRWAHV